MYTTYSCENIVLVTISCYPVLRENCLLFWLKVAKCHMFWETNIKCPQNKQYFERVGEPISCVIQTKIQFQYIVYMFLYFRHCGVRAYFIFSIFRPESITLPAVCHHTKLLVWFSVDLKAWNILVTVSPIISGNDEVKITKNDKCFPCPIWDAVITSNSFFFLEFKLKCIQNSFTCRFLHVLQMYVRCL